MRLAVQLADESHAGPQSGHPFLLARHSGTILEDAASWLLWSPLAAKLSFLLADWLNLHELPAEPPFDAEIAMSDAVVERRGYANDLAESGKGRRTQ